MTETQNIPLETPDDKIHDFPTVKYKPAISYFGQFGILIGFIGAGLIIGSFVFVIIWTLMTGAGFMTIEKDLSKLQYAGAAKTAQVISSVFMFFVPAYFYALIVNKKPFQHLGFRKLFNSKQILWVIVIAAFGFFLSGVLSEITQLIPISKKLAATFQKWEDSSSETMMAMVSMRNWKEYIFTLIVIALAPAIVEESLFRGGLQQLFEKWFRNPWIAIVVTSILFSAVHGSYYGFLSRAALGIMLGLLFYYSRNIWLNILMHFLNNAIIVTYLYTLTAKGSLTKEAFDDNLHIGYPAFAIALVLIIVLYKLFSAFKKESMILGADKIDNTFSPDDNPFL